MRFGVEMRGLGGVGIRGLVKYISIYCRWVEIMFALRIHIAFLCPTTPRRWTAIGVGAVRGRSAIDPLSNASAPIAPIYSALLWTDFWTILIESNSLFPLIVSYLPSAYLIFTDWSNGASMCLASTSIISTISTVWVLPTRPSGVPGVYLTFIVTWFNGLIIIMVNGFIPRPPAVSLSPGVHTPHAHPHSYVSGNRTAYTPGSTGGGTLGDQRSCPRAVTSQRIIQLLVLLILYS